MEKQIKRLALILFCLLLAGCAPSARLRFNMHSISATPRTQWFAIHRPHDFGITFNKHGRIDALLYDDNGDGTIDHVYHLRNNDPAKLPHFVILLDSIPYQTLADRYAAGEFRWFDPPVKVISPFPSLTKIAYTQVLHAAPTLGMIDEYYDPKTDKIRSGFAARFFGYREPWEYRLDYAAPFSDASAAYLNPRPWYHAELELARQEFDQSHKKVTIAYLASASCMVCRYGRQGANEVLDGAARLCLELLYEHHGQIEISMMADHGHNYMVSQNIEVSRALRNAGFRVGPHLRNKNDVVLELSGLVTYAGIDTYQPAAVSDILLKQTGIQHCYYMDSNTLIIRDHTGAAKVETHNGLFRYTAITSDVLRYADVISSMRAEHQMNADGYASANAWFRATINAEYPAGPQRLWQAFHGETQHTPTLMFTTLDGYCAGLPYLQHFIHMGSTHGSLNQINSATFLMTMTHRTKNDLQSPQVLPTILGDDENSYVAK
ncbi:MAG TPA: hypothetical protein VGG19_00900 [Tepidisphaeraceae bacterium]